MRRSTRLAVQTLEERALMSWPVGGPPAGVAIGAHGKVAITDKQLSVVGGGTVSNGEVDYFGYTAPTSGNYVFDVTTPTGNLNPIVGLFDGAGTRLAFNNDVSGADTDSRLTYGVTAGQKYFFGVTNVSGAFGGKYSWKITTPGADDKLENNDAPAQAKNLGLVKTTKDVTGLALRDGADWFKFSYAGLAGVGSQVQLTFTHAQGNIDLRLYDTQGNLIRASTTTGDAETVSLDTLVGGTYYVHAYGFNGATNPVYNLGIDVNATAIPAGSRALYMNFDGVNLSRAALERYNNDWALYDALASFDPNGDGIHVDKFLAPRADREQVISLLMQYVQEDVRKYGIKVVRHRGAAVENKFATTLFFGKSDLGDTDDPNQRPFHVACDIDYGNNNKTDIAFVYDETWGNNTANTAMALADVALHEAGHTWGLWHVSSGTAAESMGLRYSTPQSSWLANTSFNDVTYNEYSTHGPTAGFNDTQNSHQTMAKNFGLVSAFGAPAYMADTSEAGVLAITTGGAADRVEVELLAGGVVEVRVNGKVRRITGGGLREIRVNTAGDARDTVKVVNDLGGVAVTQPAVLTTATIADEAAAIWNGTAQTAHEMHTLPYAV